VSKAVTQKILLAAAERGEITQKTYGGLFDPGHGRLCFGWRKFWQLMEYGGHRKNDNLRGKSGRYAVQTTYWGPLLLQNYA